MHRDTMGAQMKVAPLSAERFSCVFISISFFVEISTQVSCYQPGRSCEERNRQNFCDDIAPYL